MLVGPGGTQNIIIFHIIMGQALAPGPMLHCLATGLSQPTGALRSAIRAPKAPVRLSIAA